MLTLPRQDAGFTLVEVLVAMVLLSIMIASVGRIMLDWNDAQRRSANTTKASAHVADTLDRMGNDIRQAIAPQRAKGLLTVDKLRNSLLLNNPSDPTLRDVIQAQPNALEIRSDVSSASAGAECVRYYVDNAGDFRRVVYAGAASCTGTVLESVILIEKLPSGEQPLSSSPIFSYDLTYNPVTNKSPLDPTDCVHPNAPVASQAGNNMNRISAVNVDLRSFVAAGTKSGGDLHAADKFDIETRESHDYMYAMGCAF